MLIDHAPAIWLAFAVTAGLLIAVDIGALGRTLRPPSTRLAAWWTIVVVAAAAGFCALIWWRNGSANAVTFATGYVVELALSVDNLLVFVLLFDYFSVPASLQPTVLTWGILGALVMRGVMVFAGVTLLREVHWVLYLLGALLVVTGARMALRRGAPVDPARNGFIRLVRRVLPVSDRFAGSAFVVRVGGRRLVTPLLVAVLAVEWTDLVFATDSIPAIFAITRDPFLVYTSNVFAVIGLRALYFAVAGTLARYAYLRVGVALVLVLIGCKMLASPWVTIPTVTSLVAVATIIGASIGMSVLRKE